MYSVWFIRVICCMILSSKFYETLLIKKPTLANREWFWALSYLRFQSIAIFFYLQTYLSLSHPYFIKLIHNAKNYNKQTKLEFWLGIISNSRVSPLFKWKITKQFGSNWKTSMCFDCIMIIVLLLNNFTV